MQVEEMNMRMPKLAATTFILLTMFGGPAFGAANLQKNINDPALSALLSTLKLLDEQTLTSGLTVRVFRTTDSGECDPRNEARTCPRSQIFVVATEPDGAARPISWISNKLIGWGFISRTVGVKAGPGNPFGEAGFELEVCEAPPKVESGEIDPRTGGWWQRVHYEIRVGASSIEMMRLRRPPAMCDLY